MQTEHASGKSGDVERTRKAEPAVQAEAPGLAEQAAGAQALALPSGLSPQDVLALQRTAGNRAVQRLLHEQGGLAGSISATGYPAVRRFSADPHEQMSAAALRGRGYSAEQMEDIQLGNWATDMNQISLAAPVLHRLLGFTLTTQEQSQLVELVAVGHFGERPVSRVAGWQSGGARPGQYRLGQYQEAEHFDQPVGLPAEPGRAVASHIESGMVSIEDNFTRAIIAGRTPDGRQHYGRAMHTTEDFFAHTNFVHIATWMLDQTRPKPYGGVAAGSTPEPGRFQLTSGTNEPLDTALSILHIVLAEVMKEPDPAGAITPADRIILMLVNKVSRPVGTAFETYLNARSAVGRVTSAVTDVATTVVGVAVPAIGIRNVARDLARQALEAAVNAGMRELGRRATGLHGQPSHSAMNIDDPTADPAFGLQLYPIARALAEHVVRQLDPLLQAAWDAPAGPARDAARQALFARLRTFLVHPQAGGSDWWRPIVQPLMRR